MDGGYHAMGSDLVDEREVAQPGALAEETERSG